MLEQEKAVLDEEYSQALTLNEELQVQHEQILTVKCADCAPLDNMSAQLQLHLQYLQREHRPSIIVEEPAEASSEHNQRLPPLKRAQNVHSGSSTSTGAEGVSPHDQQYSNATDGRRFSFSPYLFTQSTAGAGGRGHHHPLPEHVIAEMQSECESSFKQQSPPEPKDIVHQYFDFLHQEVCPPVTNVCRTRS